MSASISGALRMKPWIVSSLRGPLVCETISAIVSAT
jgi:hypothetical protein